MASIVDSAASFRSASNSSSSLSVSACCQVKSDTQRKPVIAIDIDEVLAQFTNSLCEFHNSNYGTQLLATSFFSYEFHKVWGGSREEANVKMELFFKSQQFLEEIQPLPDAFAALQQLRCDFDLHIVTARQHKLEEVTRSWITTNFPNIFTEIHFGNHYTTEGKSRSKPEMCREIGALLLVDDSAVYACQCANESIDCILFGDYAWNRELAGLSDGAKRFITRASTWKMVVDAIYAKTGINKSSSVNDDKALNSSSFSIAAVQLCSTNDKAFNLARLDKYVEEAASQGAVLVCLPECCVFMGDNAAETLQAGEAIVAINEGKKGGDELIVLGNADNKGPSVKALQGIALKHNVFLSVGGFPEIRHGNPSGKLSNAHFVIDRHGVILEPIYRKIHLFDCPQVGLFESKSITAGSELAVIDLGFVRLGLAICYDLRFPELFNFLSLAEPCSADIILVPSAFTVPTGKMHWEILLRARAIENQCYVIAAAQCGVHNTKRKSWGQSVIIDPWGEVVSKCKSFDEVAQMQTEPDISSWEGLIVGTFDRKVMNDVRDKMPVRKHKRSDLFHFK